jgi:hypothetical protein
MSKDEIIATTTNFIFYTTPDGDVNLQVFLENETIWLSQKLMAELFGVEVPAISKHLKNIFEENELNEKSVVSIMETTASDGKSYQTSYYNLDAIIAVGYRVNSRRATQFRIWATQILKEYMIKGFALDDNRLKQGEKLFKKDYFDELLERVRSIRASERRIYLKITDIFAECSIDYDRNSDVTKVFFATIQNKFHFAVTGQTAAEIIYTKADKSSEHMGLETWKHSPEGRILVSDVKVAKNYLPEKDIKKLERTVSSFFDYIENLVENHETFTMEEFASSVNKFLEFNEYKTLDGKGRISMKQAEKKAVDEYHEFNKTQKIESDFEKEVKKMLSKQSK